jgi:heavy metal sensor kinase
MNTPLRTRLTIVYTGVFALLLCVLGLVSYRVLSQQLDADATARLTQLTEGLHGYLHLEGDKPVVASDPDDADQAAFIREATHYFQVFDAQSGNLLVQSDALDSLGLRFTPQEVRALSDGPRTQDIITDNDRVRLSNSVISGAGDHRYLVQVGLSLRSVDSALGRFLQTLLWGIPAGLLAAAFAGRWLAGFALAPLRVLAGEARMIEVTTLGRRMPVRNTGDELDDVARAFNDTLARLDAAVGDMRQFSAALAHELRTPLTALRGEIELSLVHGGQADHGAALASQLEDIDKLTRLIDQILTLARAESGQIPLARERVDLAALGASLVEQLEPVAEAAGIRLVHTGEPGVEVHGDRTWLERMILNLLDNAIKFTPRGGCVTLTVSREGNAVVLEVKDTGRGIPPAALPHIFDRFFRADASRSSAGSGAGVGLSLVKWIAQVHGGRVTASNGASGAELQVRFPPAPPASVH